MTASGGGALDGDPPATGVTELLRAWRAGDAQAKERLMEVLYRELHAMAHGRMRGERQTSTLQTTALVHEAYLRLLDQQRVEWRDRGHFLALAATMMRRVLVDGARSRRAVKRGSGAQPVALADLEGVGVASSPDILDVDRALERLAAAFPRPARVTELRFFGGLEIEEIGEVLGVTERTVRRDWTFARAWLARELGGEPA